MVKIVFDAVSKRYKGSRRAAVEEVSLEVPEGGMCMLLGTSGSGKTTLLRMVNRLVEPTSGVIWRDGKDLAREDPIQLRRQIGYVIQQVGLFPHLTIAENIRVTGEIAGGWRRGELNERVDALLELVGLAPADYRRRYPRELSGGQQQRVGLARALTTDPSVLLMDEPFGALDAITRARLQEELLRIQGGVRKTVLFVTHDVDEALKLGDVIAVLSEGKLVQRGTPLELLTRPATDFVRQLVGAENTLRQLQYVPVTSALDQEVVVSGEEMPPCSAQATLLDALLQLLQTRAPALAVVAESGTCGYVTLASIHREITAVRVSKQAAWV